MLIGYIFQMDFLPDSSRFLQKEREKELEKNKLSCDFCHKSQDDLQALEHRVLWSKNFRFEWPIDYPILNAHCEDEHAFLLTQLSVKLKLVYLMRDG